MAISTVNSEKVFSISMYWANIIFGSSVMSTVKSAGVLIFFRTDGAAAVIRLGKTWGKPGGPVRKFQANRMPYCAKQACGQALVAAQGNQFCIRNDNMYSFSFKTVTCFGQFEQLGIDGWHNQTDVVLFGQLENASMYSAASMRESLKRGRQIWGQKTCGG